VVARQRDRDTQLSEVERLGEHSDRAGTCRLPQQGRVPAHRDNWQFGEALLDDLDQVESRAVAEFEVGQHDLGERELLERVVDRCCLADGEAVGR